LQLVNEARQFAQERGMQNETAAIDLLDARLAAARGERLSATRLAAQAEEQARRLGQRPLALQACRLQAELFEAQGDLAAAQEKREHAGQLASQMAALFSDPVLVEAFMTDS
jgi:ATP/maltotriose-dependent transcriptional regulator MalT